MKAIKIIIGILLLSCLNPIVAQEKGTSEIRLGYGIATSTQLLFDITDVFIDVFTLGDITYQNEKSTGGIHFGYNYFIGNKFTLGGIFVYEQVTNDVKSGNELIGKTTSIFYTIAIETAYHYISKENFQMYSGLGLAYTFGDIKFDSSSPDESSSDDKFNSPNINITGLGIRVGKSFGGFAEAGFGYKGIINAGIFYQF